MVQSDTAGSRRSQPGLQARNPNSRSAGGLTGPLARSDPPPAGSDPPPLSDADRRNLALYENGERLIRDRVTAVVRGYSNGYYLYGAGGGGKSYIVLDELRRHEAHFKVFNSRMTGRGLYNALEAYPDAVHVLEDMEQITRDRGAQGVLRSALWGQRRDGDAGPQERLVTWSAHRDERSFYFTGGLILIANRPLEDLPELHAVKTRIAVTQHLVSDAELRALMRAVARRGHDANGRKIGPVECVAVAEHIITESLSLHRPLDMRLLVNSLNDYAQWEDGDAACHWRDLVVARVRERPVALREPVSVGRREDRLERERGIAREIAATTSERVERARLWGERTGKSEQTLYRRLAELQAT